MDIILILFNIICCIASAIIGTHAYKNGDKVICILSFIGAICSGFCAVHGILFIR